MRIGLKSKLVLLIELSIVAVSLVVGLYSLVITRNVFENRIYSQLQSVTVLKENRIKNMISETTLQIEYIAKNKQEKASLLGLLEGDMSNKKKLDAFYGEILTGTDMFMDFMVLDTKGEVVFASDGIDEGKIKATEPYFINAKEKTFFQDIGYDVSLSTATMMVGTPIKNEKGEFVGVLVGRMSTSEISKMMQERSGLGETGESVIINANNLAITDLLKEPGSALKKTIFNPQVNKCLAGNTFSDIVIDYHGDEVFGYYSWFPEIRSCIATKVDTKEVLASLNRSYMILYGMAVAVAVMAGLVGYIIGRKLFKPLEILQSEVKKVNEGNFDVNVAVTSSDEIGEVAKTFNEMAGKLKVSYGNLEEKVAEKTKELEEKLEEMEKMNELMVGRELTMVELKKKLAEKDGKGK
jgi:HAMP domain-containing protein